MPIQLTVLGSSSAIPRAGRACSSYLLAASDRRLVVDMGTGAFANLIQYCAPHLLDGVIISHLHGDHFLDLIPLRYALKYGHVARSEPLPVYLPPGGRAVLERIGESISGERTAFYDNVFNFHEYTADEAFELAGFICTPGLVHHYIAAYAMRLTSEGTTVAYSADTAFDERLVAIAQHADLFICESTLGAHGVETGDRGHSSAFEAGLMAAQANVLKLALTHYGAEFKPADLITAAAKSFHKPIQVLDDHVRVDVTAKALSYESKR